MAPSLEPTVSDLARKKQRMISSFFAVKSAPDDLPAPQSSSSPVNRTQVDATKPVPTASARSVEEQQDTNSNNISKGQSEPDARAHKRRKVSRVTTSPLGDQTHPPSFPNVSTSEPRPSSDRALRYRFYSDHSDAGPGQDRPSDDEATTRRKRTLHEMFLRKLGDPERFAAMRRKGSRNQEQGVAESLEEHEDPGSEDELPAKAASRGKKKSSGHVLTPMEKQVIDIKSKNPGTILVVEVGYKFRFFGEDARVAAKELGVVCIPGKLQVDGNFAPEEDRFASASFPTHRLHVHVKRLVAAGHKVGIVRQLETAALKAAGANRNAPFVRKLTNLYTKGTYVDDMDQLEESEPTPAASAPSSGHILCLTESNSKGWGNDEKVQVGIVAVQPATGDIIYDDFEDGFMRGEIETRMLHIAPSEFVIVGDLSKPTERLIKHLSANRSNVFRDNARVERIEKSKTAAAESANHISNFYAGKLRDSFDAQAVRQEIILDKAHRLSEQASICLSAMIKHLSAFGLEHVFDLTKNFSAFNTRSHMLLNGNTLTSLEIYRNQTDHGERGSLVWVLDHTLTKHGKRLLRKWVGRPLLDKARLQERIDAVEELNDVCKSAEAEKLRLLLTRIRNDMEKSLIRIYYGKCSRSELLGTLQTLQMIASEYAHVNTPAMSRFSSPILGEAMARLPMILDSVVSYLDKINPEAARNNDKESFLRDDHATDDISNHKAGLAAVEGDLRSHRQEAASKLKLKSIDYVTVAGIDFLIEVDNTKLKSVPASWSKINGTKKVSRFHTPEVVKMLRQRDQHAEALAAACDSAFEVLLSDIADQYESFRDCVQAVATLDCLLSLSAVAARPDYCKPEFSETAEISVEAGRHPMVEQLLLSNYVSNDISLTAAGCRALLITGPNMGGKSSYVRQIALISIMGQIGSYVPAASAKLGMLDAVFTRMGAFDNMLAGESTFMVELNETADMLKQAGPRSLMILDELGRGTSTHDGVAIAHAVLDHIMREMKGLLLFITHYQSLSTVAESLDIGGLKNVHMKFTENTDGNRDGDLTFLYEIGEGTAHRSYGLNVARLASLPRDVLDVAARKSSELEAFVGAAKMAAAAKSMRSLLENERVDVTSVISSLEQLG